MFSTSTGAISDKEQKSRGLSRSKTTPVIFLLFSQHAKGGVDDAADEIAVSGLVAEKIREDAGSVGLLALEHGDGFLLCVAVGGAVELDKLLLRGGELDGVGGARLFRGRGVRLAEL